MQHEVGAYSLAVDVIFFASSHGCADLASLSIP
jgi:hypothetical protein